VEEKPMSKCEECKKDKKVYLSSRGRICIDCANKLREEALK
jgi:hypothetical protein